MKIEIDALDVFRLDSSYKLVVCCNESGTEFCIVSAGTGQSTKPMNGKDVFDYLIYGKNPLEGHDRTGAGRRPIFIKVFNLGKMLEETIESFGPYGRRFVWAEDVMDPEILKYHTKDERVEFDSIKLKAEIERVAPYSEEELKKWWLAYCPKCGWKGLSRDCRGGEQLADTGDYSDVTCPVCDEIVVDA